MDIEAEASCCYFVLRSCLLSLDGRLAQAFLGAIEDFEKKIGKGSVTPLIFFYNKFLTNNNIFMCLGKLMKKKVRRRKRKVRKRKEIERKRKEGNHAPKAWCHGP